MAQAEWKERNAFEEPSIPMVQRRTRRIGSKRDQEDSGRIIHKNLNKGGVSHTCFLDDKSGPCG